MMDGRNQGCVCSTLFKMQNIKNIPIVVFLWSLNILVFSCCSLIQEANAAKKKEIIHNNGCE